MCVLSIADESEVGKSIFTYSPNTSTQILITKKKIGNLWWRILAGTILLKRSMLSSAT